VYNRAQLAYQVYQRLNKSSATPGFYTEEKVNGALQEAMDYVGVKMMLADNGFLKKIQYLDVEANQITLPIPPHMDLIEEVRYLVGNVYIPLAYDSQWKVPQWSVDSGATNLPASYRIVDNKFYFNPPLGTGGTGYIQVEYQHYPMIMRNDTQQIDPQFDRAMIYYLTYRACSILASAMGSTVKPWSVEEDLWLNAMQQIVQNRNRQPKPITDFAGY
jgi:hypothetical protein